MSWNADTNTWTYVSSTTGAGAGVITFTVNADASSYLKPGVKVKWSDGTNAPGYGVVAASDYDGTKTTVTLVKQSDYVMANHAITSPNYSTDRAPSGFPSSFNWTPTLSGWSSAPSGGTYKWTTGPILDVEAGGLTFSPDPFIFLSVTQATPGTSNNAHHTITTPATCSTGGLQTWIGTGTAVDDGDDCLGTVALVGGFAAVACYPDIRDSAHMETNTASGSSSITFARFGYPFGS